MRLRRASTVLAAATAAGLGLVATVAQPAHAANGVVYGLTNANHLVTFSVSAPGTILSDVTIIGIGAGETIIGMDIRTANNKLVLVTNNGGAGKIYTLDTPTGAALAGPALTIGGSPITLSGTEFGVDFNPFADRLRIVSDTGQNLRIVPDTGASADFDTAAPGVQPDATLNYQDTATFTGTPKGVSAGYSNPVKGAASTTLYTIDRASGNIFVQTPPNNGTLTTPTSLGGIVGGASAVGFDVTEPGTGADNTGYISALAGGTATLYKVTGLGVSGTGAATTVGAIGAPVKDIALSVSPDVPPVVPEVPMAVLIPLSAAAAAGAVVVIKRRKAATA